jgi:predicted dehydrogenase
MAPSARRHVLLSISLLLLLQALGGRASAQVTESEQTPVRSPTRIAVYGLRHDHAWWVIPQLLAMKDVQLVAVAGERPDLLDRARKMVPATTQFYDQLETMLDREKPDGLVALAPNNEHRAILEACAKRKINFYTHKPMATSVADARAMDKLVRDSGIVAVIYNYPVLEPENQFFFEKLGHGVVGEIRKLVVMSGIQGPHGLGVLSADYEGWMYDEKKHGGGSLADMGTYGLIYAAWLMGLPNSVMASVGHHAPENNRGVDDESWIILEYPRASAVIQGSWSMPFRNIGELVATGSAGQLRVWDRDVWFRPAVKGPGHPEHDGGTAEHPPSVKPQLSNGVSHFVDCIRNGTAVHPAFTSSVNVLAQQMVEAAYKSSRTGRRVFLPTSPGTIRK